MRFPLRPNTPAQRRAGFSLLELLIVLAIIAILIGLLLGVVASSRRSAALLSSTNNLRQIQLATLNYHDVQKPDYLARPSYEGDGVIGSSIFELILPFIEAEPAVGIDPLSNPGSVVKTYRSPSDPSWDTKPFFSDIKTRCSYVFNLTSISNGLNIPFAIPDGTSSTIAYCESYHWSEKGQQHLGYTWVMHAKEPGRSAGTRRPSFADAGWGDVVPVSDGNGTTVPSVPGMTFQYLPAVRDSVSVIPKTPHPAGLPVALYDGSVRTLKPSISERVYWALVTHNGGEVIGDY
jgi:prepilin-type N-terminal cleavage/methylation domain-containing protein